jgi:hypothetical protein
VKGFVYFIAPEALFHRDEDTQLVKIGYTRNRPEARLAALQCGSPLTLDLFAYTNGSEELERAFHAAFANFRSHGEWFFVGGKLWHFLCYFDAPPGERYVTPDQVAVSIYDNILSDTPPHQSIDRNEWVTSVDARPLLKFYPQAVEA